MRDDIEPGAEFPDYELPDHNAERRSLSTLQGPDPMVLVLSRGGFCPKDRQQMRRLVEFHRRCVVGYARLVTITTEGVRGINAFRQGVGAQWTFLSDRERKIRQDLQIREYTDEKHDPMIPYTFVLKPGLVIHRIYNGYWYWGRPTNDELHRDLREVSRECRPDWKIDTAEMREKWESDEREDYFYPYGRSGREVLHRMNEVPELYDDSD